MTVLTPLAMSALALLAEHPMHPYEMYQTLIHRSEDRIVKVRPGSLYHTIARLADQGLTRVTGTEREGNRPERTTYEITEAGHLALAERIAQVIEEPEYEYPVFPVAISQAHNLPAATVLQLAKRRLTRIETERDNIERNRAELEEKSLPRRYWLDITYLETLFTAEAEWLRSFISELESGALDWAAEKHPAPPHAKEEK